MKQQKHKIKIGIVDDDLLFVSLLEDFIKSNNQLEVVLTAKSGNEFLSIVQDHVLDILILDLRMNDGNGLEVLHNLSEVAPSLKSIVLSTFYQRSFFGQVLKAGAHAFLPKEIGREELITAIEEVYHKGHYFSSDQVETLLDQLNPRLPKLHLNNIESLTEREIEVLKLLCNQLKSHEIAEKLFVSVKTVEAHKSRLMLKTGVKNMVGLVIYAIQNGIVNPEEVILLDP
jgi:DNA-binding NarL/FixJ family response regulator